jgi:hypothetical protein
MTDRTKLCAGKDGDVLLLSMRCIAKLAAFSLNYEFEDIVSAVTGADRVDVGDWDGLERCRRAYKLARLASASKSLAARIVPRPSSVELNRDYNLFFPMFNNAHELYALASVSNWRKRCRIAACYITEIWPGSLPNYLLEQLNEFDHIFLGFNIDFEDMARITGKPCSYLPMAADVLRFAPQSVLQDRPIDVCYIGRRSQVTHTALMELAESRGLFYFYDTVATSGVGGKQRTFQVDDPAEHRFLLANILQRSKYFVANRARANEPEVTAGHEGISSRYYEGAAAGTIMIGSAPKTSDFEQQFTWPGAVVDMPFDAPDIGGLLEKLNSDPPLLQGIRKNNVRFAALKHDWLHRLCAVFDILRIPFTSAMLERRRLLDDLAHQMLVLES